MAEHRSMIEAFAYYTECALATAEGLEMLKSSSRSSRDRAWRIAHGMVEAYHDHGGIVPGPHNRLSRLRRLMIERASREAARNA